MDMKSIVELTAQGRNSDKGVVPALKSANFFDVSNFPTGLFEITIVHSTARENWYEVEGNLTLKGITKPIIFEVSVKKDGERTKAWAETVIDRTQWGIRFRSPSIYFDLGDKAIADEIGIGLKLWTK